MDLALVLEKRGLEVVRVGDYKRIARPGSFHPAGICVHHTATGRINRPHPDRLLAGLIQEGRSDLPGPNANLVLGRDAVFYAISNGRANDTGMGSSAVLQRIRAGLGPLGDAGKLGLRDDLNLNPWYYDIEVVNDGVGENYPVPQIDALVEGLAAICEDRGWDEGHILHHRESTRRKIDMSYRGALRSRVARSLQIKGQVTRPRPRPDSSSWEESAMGRLPALAMGAGMDPKKWPRGNPHVLSAQCLLEARGIDMSKYGGKDGRFGKNMKAAVIKFQNDVFGKGKATGEIHGPTWQKLMYL